VVQERPLILLSLWLAGPLSGALEPGRRTATAAAAGAAQG
jgi:hypothetical protein